MIEVTVRAYLTSEDLFEMAYKAQRIEKNAMIGGSCEIQDWIVDQYTTVKFVVDQERARAKGLMK